jgi:hypothetical protein
MGQQAELALYVIPAFALLMLVEWLGVRRDPDRAATVSGRDMATNWATYLLGRLTRPLMQLITFSGVVLVVAVTPLHLSPRNWWGGCSAWSSLTSATTGAPRRPPDPAALDRAQRAPLQHLLQPLHRDPAVLAEPGRRQPPRPGLGARGPARLPRLDDLPAEQHRPAVPVPNPHPAHRNPVAPPRIRLQHPAHHRVHHGSNQPYLDRNYGGVLIIWDRLFGSFAAESEPIRYGLTHTIDTRNPLKVNYHEFAALIRDVRHADTWRGRLGYMFAPPGWSEHPAPAVPEPQPAAA